MRPPGTPPPLPLTPRAQRVLMAADFIARHAKCDYTAAEHILLAVLAEHTGRVPELLSAAGFSQRTLHEKLTAFFETEPETRPNQHP